MILAIDIGNTTVALGGIRDGRVCFVARMDTVRTRTAAEYRAEMDKIFAHRRHPERPMRFEGAVLTSVVPQITGALAECARHYTGKKPVIVSPEIRTGLTMGVDEPHAVGKDRLVDAAYAAANFPLPVVTVDLGIPVICYGLRADFMMRGFPGSTRLLELAHTIEELKTICACGRKAICNGRKVNGEYVFEGAQVAIDTVDDVEYQSLCPQCWYREYRAFLKRHKKD